MKKFDIEPVTRGWKAIDFYLPATDGNTYHLSEYAGENGILVAFICNQCLWVENLMKRFVRDAEELEAFGITTLAINSNDMGQIPDDSYAHMVQFSRDHNMPFPYLQDKTQEVALSWRAVCTPDFYGFNDELELQYRGRLDNHAVMLEKSHEEPLQRELFDAMKHVAKYGCGPEMQHPSLGSSIKWLAMHHDTVRHLHGQDNRNA